MDYHDNGYSQQNQVFFDDETLEKEFSDPKEALDYDGDLVFFEEDMPPINRGGMPPKKKGGKGMVFLIIAAVLLVCSIVFAVIMFIRMRDNDSDNSGSKDTTSATAATGAAATQPYTGQDDVGTTATNDSAPARGTEPLIDQVPVEDTTTAKSLKDFFENTNEFYDYVKNVEAQYDLRTEGNTLYIEFLFSGDYNTEDEEEKDRFNTIEDQELPNICENLEGTVTDMRKNTGNQKANICVLAFDDKNYQFFTRTIDPR